MSLFPGGCGTVGPIIGYVNGTWVTVALTSHLPFGLGPSQPLAFGAFSLFFWEAPYQQKPPSVLGIIGPPRPFFAALSPKSLPTADSYSHPSVVVVVAVYFWGCCTLLPLF